MNHLNSCGSPYDLNLTLTRVVFEFIYPMCTYYIFTFNFNKSCIWMITIVIISTVIYWYLTLTRVVFEFVYTSSSSSVDKNLTLTRVVFESCLVVDLEFFIPI